tara:strand:+ start:651 stop:842 length:192 start_codon:yes stop_codon:yes gene_type:complete
MHTLIIVTKSGNHKKKIFNIESRKDVEYMAGYVQACKDRGARVFTEKESAFGVLQEKLSKRQS